MYAVTREDRELIAAFEDLSHSVLTHPEHVRLAWLYLLDAPLSKVLEEFPERLKRYAESKGAPDLYHETITWAFLALINERMNRGGHTSWREFADSNPDLFERSCLERYYSPEVLASPLAREVFVLPRTEHAASGRS